MVTKHNKLILELRKLAMNDITQMTVEDFHRTARKIGVVRSWLIKDHLLTAIAQEYVLYLDANQRVLKLNVEKLKGFNPDFG